MSRPDMLTPVRSPIATRRVRQRGSRLPVRGLCLLEAPARAIETVQPPTHLAQSRHLPVRHRPVPDRAHVFHLEIGLVPLGSIGLTLFSFGLAFARPGGVSLLQGQPLFVTVLLLLLGLSAVLVAQTTRLLAGERWGLLAGAPSDLDDILTAVGGGGDQSAEADLLLRRLVAIAAGDELAARVVDGARLAVHHLCAPHHPSTEAVTDALVAQADPEDGDSA